MEKISQAMVIHKSNLVVPSIYTIKYKGDSFRENHVSSKSINITYQPL